MFSKFSNIGDFIDKALSYLPGSQQTILNHQPIIQKKQKQIQIKGIKNQMNQPNIRNVEMYDTKKQLQKKNDQIMQLERRNSKITLEKKNLLKYNKQLTNGDLLLKENLRIQETTIQKLSSIQLQNQNKLTIQARSLQQLNNDLKNKEDMINSKNLEIQKLNDQINNLFSKKNIQQFNFKRHIKEIQNKFEGQKQNLLEAKCWISYLQGQVRNANQQQEKANKKTINLNQQINLLANDTKQKIQNLTIQIQNLNQMIGSRQLQRTTQIYNLNHIIYQLQTRQRQREEQIQVRGKKVQQLEEYIQILNDNNYRSNQRQYNTAHQVQRLKLQNTEIKNQKLFENSIFDESTQRQELITSIRIQAQNALQSTKSVYSSSYIEPNANLFKLKKNHNYAFVAKTFKKNYLAAVCLHHSDQLWQQYSQNKDFIIDLNDKRNFYLKEGTQVQFTIRGNDLIFGNNDLNVQMTDFRISTNLGSNNSSFHLPYWERGIFGELNPAFNIQSFQVFELFFEKQH